MCLRKGQQQEMVIILFNCINIFFSWDNTLYLFISASLFIIFLSTTLLTLNALISGKHKGTPMLKEGIKCVGADPDDDSEQSDWAGFT